MFIALLVLLRTACVWRFFDGYNQSVINGGWTYPLETLLHEVSSDKVWVSPLLCCDRRLAIAPLGGDSSCGFQLITDSLYTILPCNECCCLICSLQEAVAVIPCHWPVICAAAAAAAVQLPIYTCLSACSVLSGEKSFM
jgi:hypothetical protein